MVGDLLNTVRMTGTGVVLHPNMPIVVRFGEKKQNIYPKDYFKMSFGRIILLKSNLSDGTKNAWTGYAFEQVCLHHLEQIRKALGIFGGPYDCLFLVDASAC